MQVYNYNDNGFYIGQSTARPDPLEVGKWLIPAKATILEPPTTTVYETAYFNGTSWVAVPDYRGIPYYILPDREPRYITEAGVDLPVGATLTLPDLTDEEKIADLIVEHRQAITLNTFPILEDFTLNSKSYVLTAEVLTQLRDIAGLLQNASDPTIYFPLEIVMGVDDEGVEDIQPINNIGTFKTAYIAVMEHLKGKREEARALKVALNTMTLSELESWIDPRV